MKKWIYLAGIILFFFFLTLNEVINLASYKFDVIVMFLLCSFLIFSGISLTSYRAAVFFKKAKLFYFCFSYLLLAFSSFIFLKKTIAYTIFDNYYFYTFKFIEIIIFYFGIFVFLDKPSLKRSIKSFAFLVVNAIIIYILLKNRLIFLIPILIYVQLFLSYRDLPLKNEKEYFSASLEFKIVAEILFILNYFLNISSIHISANLFYIFSLLMIWNYLLNIINKGYFKNIYHKERKINKLLSVNDKAIIIVENDFIKRINKRALEFLGVENSYELKGKNIHTLIEELPNDTEGGHDFSKIVSIRKVDGTKQKLKLSRHILQTLNGSVMILTLEEELVISKLFGEINTIIENMVYVYESNFGYKFIGDSVETLLGYTPDEFYKDKDFSRKISLDGRLLNSIEKEVEKVSFISEYRTKSGEKKYLKETIKKIQNDGNSVYYGVATDVTDLKHEIMESHREIAELKEIDAKKDISMSIVSHEIRTPITAIIGFLENIIMNNQDVDIRILNMINKVYSNGMRLKELVNNMLDLNKLNAGKLEIYREENDLKDLVNEILINNETFLEINKLTYENNIDESINVYADSSMLYQIINNIVSNAIKYNRENGKIIISKNELENEVILKIADTGFGIRDENKDRIFREYERVQGTKQKGTGLGLPLVKNLIELNDGKIWFESELEKGTTFYLMFKKSSATIEIKK